MARWGEGDPRWVVEQRVDGQNVNGWHWTEKSYTAWSKQKIQEIIVGLSPKINGRDGSVKIMSLKRMDGEVVVNTRKGNKRFVLYDISLTLTWKGQVVKALSTETEEVKGEIRLSEFANDNDVDDYLYEVTVEGSGQAHDRLRKAVLGAREEVLDKLHQVLKELHEII